jgi:hypothetical protein
LDGRDSCISVGWLVHRVRWRVKEARWKLGDFSVGVQQRRRGDGVHRLVLGGRSLIGPVSVSAKHCGPIVGVEGITRQPSTGSASVGLVTVGSIQLKERCDRAVGCAGSGCCTGGMAWVVGGSSVASRHMRHGEGSWQICCLSCCRHWLT